MRKRKKIILTTIIIVILILLTIPIKKSSCYDNRAYKEVYKTRCNKKKSNNTSRGIGGGGPIDALPYTCDEFESDIYKPVIGKNFKIYQNSCYACDDCQKIYYENILIIIINLIKNKGH